MKGFLVKKDKSFVGEGIYSLFIVLFLFFSFNLPAQEKTTSDYVDKAWSELGKRNFTLVYRLTSECIKNFEAEASRQSALLNGLPPKGKENVYKVMNDVATCYFIRGEAFMREGKIEQAKDTFTEVIKKYPYALAWDPRGWFWSIKEKSEITLRKLKTGRIEEELKQNIVKTNFKLYDEGSEFPIDYTRYGKFCGVGTKDYSYRIEDLRGLAKASGEGVYPDSYSFRHDPQFKKLRKQLRKVKHWDILNSRDLKGAFYKWCIAPEPAGVKQFYLGDILERNGNIKQAIKAYYTVVVFFPRAYGWTYWHTPWYIAKAALDRIRYLLRRHPEIGYSLEGAYVKVEHGFDNNIANDKFVVNPGHFVRLNLIQSLGGRGKLRQLGKVVKSVGSRVRLVKYESGDWQLRVNGKPFMVKGITYSPTRVGESPDEGTLADWMKEDTNKNGRPDGPYDSWIDKNRNNKRDKDEKIVGDFQIMKNMGVNCIRLYHQPFMPDKKILSDLYRRFGIMVIMGDFLGKYALGSGASWSKGTNYSDPQQQENMLDSVRKMVREFKDEPYILMWLLGNENVYGLGCNADKDPVSFFKFANRAAKEIKELDPTRPVAIASGDELYLDIFAKYAPDIDIFGTNAYRGKYGFGSLWQDVKDIADKPVMITEYGAPAFGEGYTQQEAEDFQAEYHRSCWEDIMNNAFGRGSGNALGGIVFEFLDEWWKAYEPAYHDKKGLFSGPFLDGYMHEEWLGVCSQGNGHNSPFLRQLRRSYFIYKNLWKKPLN